MLGPTIVARKIAKRPEDEPAQNIARLVVRAKQRAHAATVRPERRLEDLRARNGFGRVVRRDQVGERCNQHKRNQDREREYR